jgi:hypothetical protein
VRPDLALASAIGATIFARGSLAGAETPRGVELRWEAAHGCIERASLASLVERTLRRPVFHVLAPAAPVATIDGHVEPAGGAGFRAHIELRLPTGAVASSRDVETTSESCNRLDESIAVVIALMLDRLTRPAPPNPPEAGVPAPLPAPAPPPVPEPAPSPIAVPPEPARARPDAGVLAETGLAAIAGLLPDARPAAYLRAAWETGRLSVAMHVSAFLPDRAVGGGAGAEISAWAASLDGCAWPLGETGWRLGACAGGGAGWMAAAPVGLVGARETTLPLAFAAASVDGMLHVAGPLWVHLSLSGWVPLVAPHYFYHDAGGALRDVLRVWPVAPAISLGMVTRSGS